MCAPTFRLSTNGGVPYLHSENVAPKYPLSSRKKTGRKMQAKAEPLREGVVVIKEDTTMEELQELGKRFQERFGVTPVQIAIHKDEGALAGEVWKPNLHAHIVFDWYDHSTGKSIKTTSLDAIEMQTICAEVLGMERGVSSEKKHLEASRYKSSGPAKGT